MERGKLVSTLYHVFSRENFPEDNQKIIQGNTMQSGQWRGIKTLINRKKKCNLVFKNNFLILNMKFIFYFSWIIEVLFEIKIFISFI